MKLLEKEFKKSGVIYREIKRMSNPMVRIYERVIDGVSGGFTVAVIKITKENTATLNGVEIVYPEGEKFPSSTQWGTLAWDFHNNWGLAEDKANMVVIQIEESKKENK
jgi:hypothetical protein